MSSTAKLPPRRRSVRVALAKASLGVGTMLVAPVCALGQAAQGGALLTLERIFSTDEFKPQDWGPARWLEGGSCYTTLEHSQSFPELKDASDIVQYGIESGVRQILVSAARLVPPNESKPLKIEDYAWSKDTRKVLIFTNTKRVWRKETRGDYWVLDVKSGKLGRLGGKAEPSTLMFATLSPEGRRVAYVCEHNLFVQDLDTLRITQLTKDGSVTTVNGASDWVYEEEFGLRNAFRWSPDGKRLAYWQFDTSGVKNFKLINYTDSLYPEITSFAYPKVGESNSACRVGVVSASGGRTRWLRPGGDPRNHYIPMMEWTEDSRSLVFQQLNRSQNTNHVFCGSPENGTVRTLLTERDDAWVDVVESWHWAGNGTRFLWLSERDGWQHLYSVSCTNGEIRQLTRGKFDVVSIAGVDDKGASVYFVASPENPTQRYLYRASLEGTGEVVRVSPGDQPGTHTYEISDDGRYAFHTYSRFGQPPLVELVSLPDHKSIRTLAGNQKLLEKLAAIKACPSEFFRVTVPGGVQLDAWCIKPPGFTPAGRYPLLIHVYGEPASTTVVDSWGGENYLWHCLLAQQGYVVVSVDNRGTMAPRGREWRKSIYHQIGILASEDQAAAVRQILKERPYLDPGRVGVWGWSGGGSMSLNAIFRHPDLYQTAMAVAFVSNQRFYDSVYQERYMGIPRDNEAGYRDGSPITFAGQLKGNLLLVYGTGDDNCHYQNCEVLVNELIKQNKQFSVMPYPNRTHAIKEGDNTRRHLYETLTRYLREHLPANE